jgi:hypothetical protein
MIGQEVADAMIWNSIRDTQGGINHLLIPQALIESAQAERTAGRISNVQYQKIIELLARYHKSFENLDRKFNPKNAKRAS